MFKFFSQRNPDWANDKLGGSPLTVGRYGCTITSMAMLGTAFGSTLTPKDMARICKFTSDGLLIWLFCKFDKFEFERRQYGRNDKDIQEAIKSPDRGVLLQVAGGSHWVLAIGKTPNGIYKIADPWLGDSATMQRYKNDITGAAYFKRK